MVGSGDDAQQNTAGKMINKGRQLITTTCPQRSPLGMGEQSEDLEDFVCWTNTKRMEKS